MERTRFLARVRQGLAGVQGQPLPEAFPATPASGTDRSPERFLTALRAADGDGAIVDRGGLVGAIASVAASVDPARRPAVVTADTGDYATEIAEALARAHVEATSPTRENAARAGLGITSALLGVASTGSVLIASGVDSPRAASILPEAHLVILPADRLVAGLEEALEAVASIAGAYSS